MIIIIIIIITITIIKQKQEWAIQSAAKIISPALRNFESFSNKNNMPKIIANHNTLYFMRCAHLRYVQSLFANIQKQQNMLKISLLFKNAKLSRYCFYMNANIVTFEKVIIIQKKY